MDHLSRLDVTEVFSCLSLRLRPVFSVCLVFFFCDGCHERKQVGGCEQLCNRKVVIYATFFFQDLAKNSGRFFLGGKFEREVIQIM